MTLLQDHPLLEFEAFTDQDQLRGPTFGKKPLKLLPICINVYGPTSSSDKVASTLSEVSVFLQEPLHVHPASRYHNPHFLDFDNNVTPRFLDLNLPPTLDFTAEVDSILEYSGALDFSASLQQDQRIQSKLHEYDLAT